MGRPAHQMPPRILHTEPVVQVSGGGSLHTISLKEVTMPSSVMPTSRQNDGRPSPTAVSTVGLRKSYGDKTVLDGIDLCIPAGSVFALLGPNGAGKTTAVRILSTLI